MPRPVPTGIARRIRDARRAARLSQAELGLAVGLSDKAISAYEKGRSTPPVDKLQKIAESTRQPIAYFTDTQLSDVEIMQKIMNLEHELNELKQMFAKKYAETIKNPL